MNLLETLGLSPSEQDKQIKSLVDNSYNSLRVVGRGTIRIDPKEVGQTLEFKEARKEAAGIVRGQYE